MFKTQKHPALVGIVPRKNLWDIIQKERWYHIPVESAPKNVNLIEYLSFYFPSAFGEELRYKVNFYANVKKVDVVKRIQLFPEEKKHIRANKDYFQFHLGEIKELPKPIPSLRWRRIAHIPTSYEKLFSAEEINKAIHACLNTIERTIKILGGVSTVQALGFEFFKY